VKGAEIIQAIDVFNAMAEIVRGHHERFDGKGYPDKLAGGKIPFISRMLAVCDSFDALTTARCYRRPVSVEAALLEIEHCAGTQFDPAIARAFIHFVRQYEKSSIIA
jgi:HD-GYP domain-containing protein (c-di-GMP phosphodiesterase class II)